MYETILVPTDGSDGAKAAARHALNLANAFDSHVLFVNVIDKGSYSGSLAGIDSLPEGRREALEERASDALETLEALAEETSIPFRTTVEYGVPYKTIPSYAAEHDVDLIAMGTQGRTGLDRYLLGSVTERVVRTSDIPMLTTRDTPEDGSSYEDVLIPTDGSDAASAAIEHGLAVAERYDATVHALSVVDVGSLIASYDVATIIEALRNNCEDAVEEVADAADSRDIDVVTEVEQGTPYRAIKSYTETEGIDLVTMGTHGRTGIDHYLVGSVTARTVRTSEVPVLTVGSQ